jgi:UDP-N-acetylmuramyl pentapeptide phosphotransferase/UDP-N-acetylglucosamine-1-phosphate transferase
MIDASRVLTACAIALACASVATAILWCSRQRLPHAAPNARSLHDEPVPRVGGLAIWAGFAPSLLLAPLSWAASPVIVLALAAVGVVSLVDDWRGVAPVSRLLVHVAAAALAAFAVRGDASWAWALLLAMPAIIWSANAFNFMDGSDGLAALCAMLGFATYGAASIADGSGAAYFALAAAVVPFAVMNRPPARIFMGDCGAVPLGFLAALAGIAEWRRGAWPAWFPLLVFLPFLADATATLVQRALRGERVWEAHRSHYYQRVLQMGAGHAGTLRLYGALMAGTGASALVTLALMPALGWPVLAVWCAVLGAFFRRVDYHWRSRTRTGP